MGSVSPGPPRLRRRAPRSGRPGLHLGRTNGGRRARRGQRTLARLPRPAQRLGGRGAARLGAGHGRRRAGLPGAARGDPGPAPARLRACGLPHPPAWRSTLAAGAAPRAGIPTSSSACSIGASDAARGLWSTSRSTSVATSGASAARSSTSRTPTSATTSTPSTATPRSGHASPSRPACAPTWPALCATPTWAFFRNYVLRGGLRLGKVGLTISVLNSYYTFLKRAKLLELTRDRDSR